MMSPSAVINIPRLLMLQHYEATEDDKLRSETEQQPNHSGARA
jgi:hypothetical protein